MTSIAKPTLKPLLMADACLLSLPSISTVKFSHQCLSIEPRPTKLRLHLSYSHSFSALSCRPNIHLSSIIPFAAQTSDWAQEEQEENNPTITITESDQEEPTWENQESDGTEAGVSDWDLEGENASTEAFGGEDESGEDGGFEEAGAEEEFVEPPEDAKLFVGNLPYNVDSQKLAMLFEKAGTVEIAEVIYNRETGSSRGFGFVTMSTVEESEKAVEMFHHYDVDGRLLTVNKAAPRGSRPEYSPRVYEPSYKIYVGNLSWDVDDARLEQVFSEYGKVVNARVISDRETGRSRGFGFVSMSTESELNDAIAGLDGQTVDGRAIRVHVAEDRARRSF